MRKKSLMLLCLLMMFVITGCNSETKDNQNKEITNLKSELLKNKYQEFEFKCDGIKGNIANATSDYVITNDGKLYKISLWKKFSDDTNCKFIDYDVKFKQMLNYDIVIGEDNNLYSVDDDYNIVKYNNDYNNYGKVYNYIISKYGNDVMFTYLMSNMYLIVNNNEVSSITLSYNSANEIDERIDFSKTIDDNIINIFPSLGGTVLTNNSIYTIGYVNEDKCKNYVDIECEKGLVKNELFTKYSSSIQAMINGAIIDNENNLYSIIGG